MHVLGVVLCILPLFCTSCAFGEFTNDFIAEIDGGDEVADLVATVHGLKLLRKFDGLHNVYHFTHDAVHERSKRSSDDVLDRLSDDPNVKFVEQQKVLHRIKRGLIHHKDRDIVYDKQLELKDPKIDQNKVLERFFGSGSKRENQRCQDSVLKKDLMDFNDPLYCLQWQLTNKGQTGGIEGNDLRAMGAWKKGYDGSGVVVTVLDDGLDHKHPDLKDNYDPKASFDLNDLNDMNHDPSPVGGVRNAHGTRCAGEIAGKANNGVCGVGLAYNSKIGGIRLLDGDVTDGLEGQALSFRRDYVDIYSASWGPRDDGRTLDGPRHYAKKALQEGASEGRGGKGSIYVWATGNGGEYDDDCNCDGYVGDIHTIAIGSINKYGLSSYFSEICPSTMAVVFTGGSHARPGQANYSSEDVSVITDDIEGGCDVNFQGTSSAAPLAAACIALMLQANPNVTWRDVQNIIVETARIPNGQEDGWTINGGGHHVNPRFGFGVLDCNAMVEKAETWKTVAEQHACEIPQRNQHEYIVSGGIITQMLNTDGCSEDNATVVMRLEHTELHINIQSSYRGDLSITLVSPRGTKSEMLSVRPNDASSEGLKWTFLSVHNWGEDPSGTWTLTIQDKGTEKGRQENTGELVSWSLTLYGVSSPDPNTPQRQDKDEKHDQVEQAHQPEAEEVQDIYSEEKTMSELQQESDDYLVKLAEQVINKYIGKDGAKHQQDKENKEEHEPVQHKENTIQHGPEQHQDKENKVWQTQQQPKDSRLWQEKKELHDADEQVDEDVLDTVELMQRVIQELQDEGY